MRYIVNDYQICSFPDAKYSTPPLFQPQQFPPQRREFCGLTLRKFLLLSLAAKSCPAVSPRVNSFCAGFFVVLTGGKHGDVLHHARLVGKIGPRAVRQTAVPDYQVPRFPRNRFGTQTLQILPSWVGVLRESFQPRLNFVMEPGHAGKRALICRRVGQIQHALHTEIGWRIVGISVPMQPGIRTIPCSADDWADSCLPDQS